MKTIRILFFVVSLLSIHWCAQAQRIEEDFSGVAPYASNVPERIIDIVSHDVSLPQFVYDKTFELGSNYNIDFNLPFAHNFQISGHHVSFTVDKEDFDWYFYRNHVQDGYYDLKISIYYSATGPNWGQTMPVISETGIIRIMFR